MFSLELAVILSRGATNLVYDSHSKIDTLVDVYHLSRILPDSNTQAHELPSLPRIRRALSSHMYRHCDYISDIKLLKTIFHRNGYVIRKGDKSDRFVICKKAWEEAQLQALLKDTREITLERGLQLLREPQVGDQPSAIPRCYFVPKLQKPNPVPGRPIVSWCHVKQSYADKVKDALKHYIRSCPYIKLSVEECLKQIKGISGVNCVHRCGDLKSMFPAIPRRAVLQALESLPELAEVLELVRLHFSRTVFRYEHRVFQLVEGLDIGSKISPYLALFWLACHLNKLSDEIPPEVTLICFVDDLCIRCVLECMSLEYFYQVGLKVAAFIAELEKVLHPVRIEWKIAPVFMDCYLSPTGTMDLFLPSAPLSVSASSIQYPPRLRRAILRSRISRVISREATLYTSDDVTILLPRLTPWQVHFDTSLDVAQKSERQRILELISQRHSNGDNCQLCKLIHEVKYMLKCKINSSYNQRVGLSWIPAVSKSDIKHSALLLDKIRLLFNRKYTFTLKVHVLSMHRLLLKA
jgi:hypothetical protein